MNVFRLREKQGAVRDAEKEGIVADSMDVRKALIARMHAGELTLEQVQAQLASIKRSAKKNGMTTRNRVFREN